MKAALEGQKAVFLHNVGTLIVQSLHVASIKIKLKLSSSQEPSKCLLEVGHGPYYGDCRINIPSDFYPVCEIFPDISQNSVSTKFQFIQ